MIGAILDGDEQLHQACCDTIYPLAEGKPFYVEELLKALLDAGDLAASDAGWRFTPPAAPRLPQSLSGLIQLRVEGLSPEARELLAAAAVIGRRFDLALLEWTAQVGEQELLRRIKELVAAQLVVEEAPDSFAFRHALTQQAIYGGLLARERRALHEAAAAAIEAGAQGGPEAQLGELARHYGRAERWPQALAYAGWAGEQAQRLHAPQAAVALYSLALEAATALGRPAGARAPRLELAPARLHLARGQAHEMLGAFEAAREDYERALGQARASGDVETEWAALSDAGALWSGRNYSRAGERWREALALARTLGRPALVAHSLNRVGNWLVNTGRPREGLGLHHEALQIFEGLDDQAGAAQTLERLGMASFLGADVAASVGFYEQAGARFTALGDRYGLAANLVMTMSTRAGSLFFDPLGDDADGFPRALADGERALALARELGWRAGEAFALWALASLLGHHGAYGRAIELAQQGRQLADAIGHTQWAASSRWMLGMLQLDLLAPQEALAELEEALALAQASGSAVWTHHAACALAVAYLRVHERERAERLLEMIFGAGPPDAWSGQAALLWARASLALARRDGAAALRLLEGAGLGGPATPGRETTRLMLVRGEALAALGRGEEAEGLLGELRDLARRQGAGAPLLAAHLALGGLYHGARRADEAQREYGAARQLAEALAAGLPEGALRAGFLQGVAGRIPGRYGPSSRRARAARYDGLTARELEVAGLVARGRSNREIAEELVIGERTVETHISNIFAKLRAASRQEVAAWARRKGLPA